MPQQQLQPSAVVVSEVHKLMRTPCDAYKKEPESHFSPAVHM